MVAPRKVREAYEEVYRKCVDLGGEMGYARGVRCGRDGDRG
jgi:hypothetical protein